MMLAVITPCLALLAAAPASVLGEQCDSCRWRADHVGFIEPGSHTSWGDWGFMEHCPDGFYVSGYQPTLGGEGGREGGRQDLFGSTSINIKLSALPILGLRSKSSPRGETTLP